jgi:hypothetical protein
VRIESSNKYCSALMSAAALLCVPLASHAIPPEMGVIGPIENKEFFIGECGSFQVWADFTVVIPYTEHYNKEGELIFTNYRLWSSDVTYYNSTNPSIFVIEKEGGREIAVWNWEDGFVADLGRFFKITLPGQGVIYQTTGRTLMDLATFETYFFAGQHDFEEGNVAALCAAFAG